MNKHGPAKTKFVVCVCNDGYPASLEVRKIYRAIAAPSAAAHDLLRVIDETGEDYLYPARFFKPIELPPAVRRALRLRAGVRLKPARVGRA
jgi:hypothetical protein